jgi:O-antigen/teichoic acid export membrane protein
LSLRSVNRGLVSGSVGMASRAAIQLCLLGVTILATWYLSIEDFAAYSLAAALMFLSRNLFYVGPYEYLLKTPDSPHLKGACLWANLTLAILASIGMGLFSLVAEKLFGTHAVSFVLLWLIPSLFIAATTSWYEAILLRGLRVRRYYMFTVVGEIAGAIAASVLLAAGYGLMSLVAQVYVRLGTLLLLYLVSSSDRPWHGSTVAETRRVIEWSRTRYTAVFLNFGSNYGSDFILGALLSPAATGIYRASNRIVSALTDLFAQPLQKIVQTNVSARAARGLRPDTAWIDMFTGVAPIAWAGLAGLAVAADDLVPLLLGEKWHVAVPVVLVFCVVRAFGLIDATTTSLLICCDRQRFMLRVQMTVASLVLLTSALFARHGPMTVAISTGVLLAAMSLTYCREAARLSGASGARLLQAFAIALIPALAVVASVMLLRLFQAPSPGPAWMPMVERAMAAALGLAVALVAIRRPLLASIGQLGHVQPVSDSRC